MDIKPYKQKLIDIQLIIIGMAEAMLITLSIIIDTLFISLCLVSLALTFMTQLWIFATSKKPDDWQRKYCRFTGVFLLVPSLLVALAAITMRDDGAVLRNNISTYIMLGALVIMSISLLLRIILNGKQKILTARYGRLTDTVALMLTMSMALGLILTILTNAENYLARLSAGIFGVLALAASVYMILLALCGYVGFKESVDSVKKYFRSKKLTFTKGSLIKDIILVLGKLIISIISASFFMFINALYSVGMGLARVIAIKMYSQTNDRKIVNYRNVGMIILFASLCYIGYSARLFFGGNTGKYDMIIAIMIACYTFAELYIDIREAWRLRRSSAYESKALRAISAASTMLCFVLTQTAIMSFASAEGSNRFTNALSGVVFGGLAAVIGIYVIIRSYYDKRAITSRLGNDVASHGTLGKDDSD